MGLFWMHVLLYASTNSLMVVMWGVASERMADLPNALLHPALLYDLQFWPALVIGGWGVLLAIHLLASLLRKGGRSVTQRNRPRHRGYFLTPMPDDPYQGRTVARPYVPAEAAQAVAYAPGVVETRIGPVEAPALVEPALAAPPASLGPVTLVSDVADDDAIAPTDQPRFRQWHQATVEAAVARHGGIVMASDPHGYLVTFDDVLHAVAAAAEVQAGHTGSSGIPPVRFGLGGGPGLSEEQRTGEAARATDVAGPSEVVCSSGVAAWLEGRLPVTPAADGNHRVDWRVLVST